MRQTNQLTTQLQADFPEVAFKPNHVLADQTYFKIGGPAECYLETADAELLSKLMVWASQHQTPLTFIGGASNVLVADEGIPGLVIKLTHTGFEQTEQNTLIIGAGLQTALAVRKSIDAGYTGLEYFLGVPGTIGGAIYNNAHYLQSLIGQHIKRVKIIDLSGKISWLAQEECAFGYDTSRFHQTNELIFEAEFELASGDAQSSKKLIAEASSYRAQTQPLGMPSSGCIFQNVPNSDQLRERFPQFADKPFVPGGFLIDQAGLKGQTNGPIEVSQVHAAFFVNHGGGTAKQVVELVNRVKQSVFDQFGVQLQEEIFYLS